MSREEAPQECLLFIDWLGLSLRIADEPRAIPNYVWREYSSTNVWRRRNVLYTDRGDRVLTLLFDPISNIISSNAALLEVDNEWLYHGTGTWHILEVLLQSVFYEITGISRLDLAVDFCPNDCQANIIRGLSSGQYYIGGKRNGSQFWSTNTNEKLAKQWQNIAIPHCQSWGHKTSDIRWKLYYKTKELLDAGGGKFMEKPYIVDHWRMHGMDISNVWRLEVSCHHLNNLTLMGNPITLGELAEYREELFLSLYNSRFQVKANQGHKDRTNDDTIPFLPLHNMQSLLRYAEPRRMAEHNGRITLLRHLVSSLEDEHVLLDKPTREGVLEHIRAVVERDHLENYFRMVTGKWLEEFTAVTNDNANGLLMANKGSIAAERREIPDPKRVQADIRPKTDFEQYDADNKPIPTGEGDAIRARRAARAEKQYDRPLTIRKPPSGKQLRL